MQAGLTSHDLLPGEQASLIVRVYGTQPDSRPIAPEIKGVAVNFIRSSTQIDSQRRLGYAFLYRLTPVKAGAYTVPEIQVSSQGKNLKSEPIPFTVHSPEKLFSLPTGVRNQTIRAAWFPAKTSLYQGEQCQVFLKLYIPGNVNIANWGYPHAQKVNCLAWRFSPPPEHGYSQVQLDQVTHRVVTYSTNLSGISAGKATLGPSDLTLYQRRSVMDPVRGSVIRDVPVKLTLPAVHFDILALPEGAPDGFNGAVGDFQIDARCENTTLSATDPTEVILRVAGTGNLLTLKAPVLTGTDWKVIDTSKITRGEERRYISGMVTFRQLIRPNLNSKFNTQNSKFGIPPYSFSYFNPDTRSYITLTTPEIPVTILPPTTTTTPPDNSEKTGTDPEEMRNIIGFIERPTLKNSQFSILNSQFFNLLPAALCLLIIAPLIRRKIASAKVRHPDADRQDTALQKITEDSDARTFYRRAGRYIEQWLPLTPELESIIEERDKLCFKPATDEKIPIPSNRKNEIIKLLKSGTKFLLILLTTVLTLADVNAEEAEAFWKSGNYQQAIQLYQKAYPDPSNTPADVLFNIGNCYHRLDQKGAAALAWRRALLVDPTHQKSRQNLRFVEIETNASVPTHKPWQQFLAYLHPSIYRFIFYGSLWLIGIIVLLLIVRRPRGLGLTACIILLVISPAIATLGKIGSYHYPDDHRLAPPEQQAIILRSTQLHGEAHRKSSATSISPASLVKINATRGPWTHVTTADASTGWIESKFLGRVIQ